MRKKQKKVTYEQILDLFFEKTEPPCKKGEKFIMDGLGYICTESDEHTFEYRKIGGGNSKAIFTRF